MLTLGIPAHTLIYHLTASDRICVTQLHPSEVSPTRDYYTIGEFMALIGPDDEGACGYLSALVTPVAEKSVAA